MIKAIIFDCFGVLTADRWVAFYSTLPKGEVMDRARTLNRQYDAGKISRKALVDEVHEISGRDRQIIEDIFTNTGSTGKNTELINYIRDLKKEYKIGLLSNVGTNWVREDFLTADEQKLFDDMTFSYEVGATKPDARIYQAALEKLGVKPSEAVLIDDQQRFCEGAEAVGMKAIWYRDFEQMKTDLKALLAQK